MVTSTRNGPDDFDVIIVGSGLTGMTAAYSILKKHVGLNVLLLEENGGRILLEKDTQSFHGSVSQKHVTSLLTELEVLTETNPEISEKSLTFLAKNGPLPERNSSIVYCEVYHFFKSLEYITNEKHVDYFTPEETQLAELSINDFIEKSVYSPQSRSICKSLFYVCCGIENLKNVSALWFIKMLRGAGGIFNKLSTSLGDSDRFFIEGGFAFLVNQLEKKIVEEKGIIRLLEKVNEIKKIDDRIYVSTSSRRFKCDYIVIAVPPPVSLRITFDPPLPETLLESQSLYEPGKNIFFTATYSEAFWPVNSSGGIVSILDSRTKLRMLYNATHSRASRSQVLAGFLTRTTEDSSSRTSVFRILNKCFGTRRATDCVSFDVSQWVNGDPGSPMSVLRPCGVENHRNPMLVSLERIFFAASEYAISWPGTADGAIEAGKKVACSILYHARPQALSRNQTEAYTQSRRPITKTNDDSAIAQAHLILLGLNVCLFFFLLRDTYKAA